MVLKNGIATLQPAAALCGFHPGGEYQESVTKSKACSRRWKKRTRESIQETV